jgi:hypothetical protein
MKTARDLMAATAAGVLLIVVMVIGPVDRALAEGEEEGADFGELLTDIGPDATEALRQAFRDDAQAWLDASLFYLTPDAEDTDPSDWTDLCTQFNAVFEGHVTTAKEAAAAYLGDAWKGDLPNDWNQKIRDGRKFILYMANAGYKAYSEWVDFAVWAKDYRADEKDMGKKITEIGKDFVELDELISKASAAVVERKKSSVKKLKDILKDVERFDDVTIPNDFTTLDKYRDLVESRTKPERNPDKVKEALEKAGTDVDNTVKLSVGTFPATSTFAENWVANSKQLAEDYKEAYDGFIEATNPIMGNKPKLWSELTQFEDWEYSQFKTKLAETRKTIQREITRLEGVRMVD